MIMITMTIMKILFEDDDGDDDDDDDDDDENAWWWYPGRNNETLTMSFITTYAKITCRRRFLHLVHVMPTAISRQDRDIPFTALAAPVEADLSTNHTVFFFRMLANQPPRSVSSTVLCWDTGIGNLGAGIANKLEPFSYYCRIPFVAFEIALP